MSTDLETRVANRKRELIAEIIDHKRNSSRWGAADAIEKLKHHLLELSQIVGTNQRWASLSEATRSRLADWVTR